MAEAVTLTDDATLRDPFSTYQWMRDHAPIYRDPVSGFYITPWADLPEGWRCPQCNARKSKFELSDPG